MSTFSAGTAAPTFSIIATVVFHSSGECPWEFVILDRLWHAEQVSAMRSLASPSGNWTAARSCVCSCPLAGTTKSREPAIVQIKSDLMDIVPPSGCTHHYLRRRNRTSRYTKIHCGGPGLPYCLQPH